MTIKRAVHDLKKLTNQKDFHKELIVEMKTKVRVVDSVPTVCKVNVQGLIKPLKLKFTYATAGALKFYLSNVHVEPTVALCEKRIFGRP